MEFGNGIRCYSHPIFCSYDRLRLDLQLLLGAIDRRYGSLKLQVGGWEEKLLPYNLKR